MTDKFLPIFLVLIGGFYGALAPVFLKKGLTQWPGSREKSLKNILAGIFIFGSALLPLIVALKFSDLSLLYPLTGLSYVWTALYSGHFLKEKINRYTWIGIAFTVSGVFLIGFTSLIS